MQQRYSIRLPPSMVVRLTKMSAERETSVEKLIPELLQLGVMYLARDNNPPKLNPWNRTDDIFGSGDRD